MDLRLFYRLVSIRAFILLVSPWFHIRASEPDPFGIMTQPIPSKTVVLTFDDSVYSHSTIVAPILKQHGFNGTFYICNFKSFETRKDLYMTYDQINGLENDGFEVGNHTKGHSGAAMFYWTNMEDELLANGLPMPTTIAWPVYAIYENLFTSLRNRGYVFGRGGGRRPYRPSLDYPLNVPSYQLSDTVSVDQFISWANLATAGKPVVFTLHGVPEGEHPQVSLEPETFRAMMQYLKDHNFNVISMRDLGNYIDPVRAMDFIPYFNLEPWGGFKIEGSRLYLSIKSIPENRQITIPRMTRRILKAWVFNDPDQTPLSVEVEDSALQTITIPSSLPPSRPGFPTVVFADLAEHPTPTILEFGFVGCPPGRIEGDQIRVFVPESSDLQNMTPVYDTGSDLVTGVPASGVVADFRAPRSFVVTNSAGESRSYQVTVIPRKGAVAISNSGFEKVDLNNPFHYHPPARHWELVQPVTEGSVSFRNLYVKPMGARPRDGSKYGATMQGDRSGITQTLRFDSGRYVMTFDLMKRRGYAPEASPLNIRVGDQTVMRIPRADIPEEWRDVVTPAFETTQGEKALSLSVERSPAPPAWGVDIVDNLEIHYLPEDHEDVDGDGICCLIEFVMGTDRFAASVEGAHRLVRQEDDSSVLFEYPRSRQSLFPGLRQEVEYSYDMISWVKIPVPRDSNSEVTISPGVDRSDLVSVRIPTSGQPVFVRLRVSE